MKDTAVFIGIVVLVLSLAGLVLSLAGFYCAGKNEVQSQYTQTHYHLQTDTTITIINGKSDTTYTYKLK